MKRGRWLEVCWYLALSALVLAANYVRGAQFYVAPGGSNASAGTVLAPWATLQHAADVVRAGDRVVVRAGNYAGFYLDTSGLSGQPIEFFAEPGAIITQPNATTSDGINLEGASYITIDGFAVTGMPRAGVRSVGFADDFAEFVTVRNVHAYNNGRWGIFTGHVDDLLIENNETSGSVLEHGIYVSNSGDRPVLRGNYSWGNHGSGIHMNGDLSQGGDGIISNALVSRNRIVGNAASINGGPLGGGSGINMDGVQNSRIENNLIYGNHASGISLYRIDAAAGSRGNVIVNNTIHQAADGRWALNVQNGATSSTVLNNILVTQHATRGAIDISTDSLPGLLSDYNALVSRLHIEPASAIYTLPQWQTATKSAVGAAQDLHSFVATPQQLFVDWAAGDYQLRPGSPAINKGTSLLAPTVDLFGNPRPAGAVDIGAVEFQSLTADFTGDGQVNAADLATWRTAFGASATADSEQDGDTDGADFLVWQRQLNGVAIAAQVPEPMAKVMTVAIGLGVVQHCRRFRPKG